MNTSTEMIDLGNSTYADLTASGAWCISDEDAALELSLDQIRILAAAAGVVPPRRPWVSPAVEAVATRASGHLPPFARALQEAGFTGGVQRRVHTDLTITFGGYRYALPLRGGWRELAGREVTVYHSADQSRRICITADEGMLMRDPIDFAAADGAPGSRPGLERAPGELGAGRLS